MEEELYWNITSYFDYLEFALNPTILGDSKPSANGDLWLAVLVGFVGQNNFKKVEVMFLSATLCQKWNHFEGKSRFFPGMKTL